MMDRTDKIILSLKDIQKYFGPVKAIKNMQLTVRQGTVHTLLGENGAGKSTLMKILAGVYPQTAGQIIFDGEPYSPKNPREAVAKGLSIVFQELSLCNNMSVAENIFATHEPQRFGFINDRQLRKEADELIAYLELPIRAKDKVNDLSIAQRQLVEIAKGLSKPAKVLILDEPTSSLSDSEAEILFSLIDRLKERGTAIIYISHRMEEIMRLSDDITVVRDGEYIDTKRRQDTNIDELIAMMVGRKMDEIYPPALSSPNFEKISPILEVEKLSYKDEFQDVSFAIRPGEILGFFGLVGSGRSEVMNAIFGMKKASGTIRLEGKAVNFKSAAESIAAGIGFVTENRKEEGLILNANVMHNISMASLKGFTNKLGFMNFGAEKKVALQEAERLSVKASGLDTVVNTLSGGNQQKIVFAKWLLTHPKVLILDEPTRGVDVGAKFEIYKIIRQLADEGTAILLVSSELPEVLGLADRLIVMTEGCITATLNGADMTPQNVMAFATGTVATGIVK
ncbi:MULTISPECIES: sugar ABC transporter ATP-binding protein [unclassified Bartonella]|uniref:sugar ABC transporter ATP-binding protein n=1 Tax=unclassified Bartonella TaxID=2645622 RepID=UPI0021C67A7C|nr:MULTISPECIES: sugar ABC transporter ATP-binding protein [unclassified Bartonella]UXN03166.1 sugar ABC transporter ATP-binding protein [Bartonella sp. HY406]UXN06129.1 sugar ABC transporter ATP-binding protein [Bartonella sp. HY761]